MRRAPLNLAPASLPRRLCAIAFADIVGYSVLTAADERGVGARWMALFHGLVKPAAIELGGRIVDVQGDGILAEFPDVEAALAWARRLHAASEAAEQAGDAEAPIVFRIGIHAGSVMVDGPLILGDAVNLAARLQEYGPPGGILLSAEAAALAPEAERAAARPLGALPLRNMSRAVKAFSIDPARQVAVPLAPVSSLLPSIAVLPLESDPEQPQDEYLASGVVEDIAASLAGLHELFVIAPDTARMFSGLKAAPARAARMLGVRFIVSGSLRRRGGGLQAQIRLTDGPTGELLWSDRMDAAEREIFEFQEHVAARVVAGVAPSIRASALREAMRKRPESLTAYDHMLRGLHAMASPDRTHFLAARAHLDRAMEEDGGFAQPLAWAAHWHSLNIGQGWSEDRAADTAAIFDLAGRALALEPGNALAQATFGHNSAYLRRDPDTAMQCFEMALARCPNSAIAWTLSSATLGYLGRGAQAVEHAARGLRLSPYDPLRYYHQHFLSIAHYVAGAFDEAERYGRLAIGGNPSHASNWRVQAAALAAQGRAEEAREAAARLIALEPDFSVGSYSRDRMPFREAAVRERFARDLRAAGLPA
jgi:adenylate cyclase